MASFLPVIVAVPMVAQLRRRRTALLPKGSGWWLAFMVFVLLSAFALISDAPGAVPGGNYVTRAAIWGFDLSLYAACTVALVWAATLSRDELPFRKLAWILSWLYLYSTLGGLVGVFFPTLELKSALEVVLPQSLAQNGFVQSLIHPAVADIQTILGYAQARPKAPFAYANTWGSVVALSLPFFLLAWFRWGSKLTRIVGVGVLMLSSIPIVYSLNRGLWVCLAVGLLYLVFVRMKQGRSGSVLIALLILAIAAAAFAASPLSEIVGERFQHQHSNDRRGQLLIQTVESALEGSPIIGFGGTRDVQGSFASIAGGATPECPGCGVPPLGTQGQIWLVSFAQGLIAALMFLMFFLAAVWRSAKGSTTPEHVAGAISLFFLIQVFVYDTLGLPLMIVVLGIAAGWREDIGVSRVDTVASLVSEANRWWRLIVLAMAIGAVIGSSFALTARQQYAASAYVLLSDTPSYLPTNLADRAPRRVTIDTEAALVVAESTLRQVRATAEQQALLRSEIQVTAIPNTKVLVITIRSTDPSTIGSELGQVASAYLRTRQDYLINRQQQLIGDLYSRAAELTALGKSPDSVEVAAVQAAISKNLLTPTSAGSLIRTEGASPVSRDAIKYFGSGLALGFLIGALLVAFRPRGLVPVR